MTKPMPSLGRISQIDQRLDRVDRGSAFSDPPQLAELLPRIRYLLVDRLGHACKIGGLGILQRLKRAVLINPLLVLNLTLFIPHERPAVRAASQGSFGRGGQR